MEKVTSWIVVVSNLTGMGAIVAKQDTELLSNEQLAEKVLYGVDAQFLYEGTQSECMSFLMKRYRNPVQYDSLSDAMNVFNLDEDLAWFISKEIYYAQCGYIHDITLLTTHETCCVAVDVAAGNVAILAYNPDGRFRYQDMCCRTLGCHASVYCEGDVGECIEYIKENFPDAWVYDYTNHIF